MIVRSHRRHAAFALLIAGSLAGCALSPSEGAHDEVEEAATTETLQAKLPGMTVWVDAIVRPDHRFGTDVWVIRGRTSKNLTHVLSFLSDDEFGDAQIVSPRVFEITVDGPSMAVLLNENRLFLSLTTAGDATQYTAAMLLLPKLASVRGSSKIYVHTGLRPVLVGDAVRVRGEVTLATGVSDLAGLTATGPIDALAQGTNRHESFDLGIERFIAAAHVSPSLTLTARASSKAIETDASFALDVSTLGLTIGIPYDVFPDPPCDIRVEACLDALPATSIDTGNCGTAKQVQTCRARPSFPRRFAVDLQSMLTTWYAVHASDVAAAGGRTLAEAQAAVDVTQITELTTPSDDPEHHDLTTYRVFTHPDVVFPSSDRRWFGAYTRTTAALSHVYDHV